MRFIVALLCLTAVAVAVSDYDRYVEFKAKYGRSYTANEDGKRFSIFQSNLRKAEALTAADPSAVYGVTQFSDLTSEEFIAHYTGLNLTFHREFTNKLPAFPYTQKMKTVGTDQSSKTTDVKNQGSCGSCWAFSATAAAEACNPVKGRKIVDLSPQQIMDCCDEAGCDGGCSGGFEYTALEWAAAHDLATLKSYPYTSYGGTCKAVTEVGLPANTCKFYKIEKTEKAMTAALEHTTVTVALDATQLQLYSSGILSRCSGTSLNHALLLVSDEAEGSSYKIKNSWGASWGEKGYFRMVKDKGCLGINLDFHSCVY